MQIKTFNCKVQVDGADAPEYKEETADGGRTTTCTIPSKEGARFQFVLDIHSNPKNHDRHFTYHVFTDGEISNRHCGQANQYRPPVIMSQSCLQIPGSSGMFERRDFKFGKLDTVETNKPNVENRLEVLKEVGTLKVVVWECTVLSTTRAPVYAPPDQKSAAAKDAKNPVLEKALKGRSVPHRTALGNASYMASSTTQAKLIEPPAATFIFKYTSEESLKNSGIIPSNSDDEDDKDKVKGDNKDKKAFENSTAKARQEQRRQREEKEADSEDEDEGNRRRKIKMEIKQEKQKLRPVIPKGPIEVIDLLDD